MARKVVTIIEVTDDLDKESHATATVELGLDGSVYELDLTEEHAEELRNFLQLYQEAAHDRWKMPARPKRKRRQQIAALEAGADVLSMPTKPTKPRSMTARANQERLAKMGDRDARRRIREWAKENGHPCSDVGKIPTDTLALYHQTFPDAYIPWSTMVESGLAVAQ